MIIIRDYREGDAGSVGRLIADTYSQFNLAFATPQERAGLLGPFHHARSNDPAHQEAIAQVIQADILLVAEDEGEIVGVLRGRRDKLQSLFVRGDRHQQGIGRQLVIRFEEEALAQGASLVKVQSTLFAVPFYTRMGYKKSTGIRTMRSFQGTGLKYQPMKKIILGRHS